MSPIWYILKGREVVPAKTMLEYERTISKNRRIALTRVKKVIVSTVFLGINHQWGDGPPLVFETMVFGGKFDREMEMYSTYDEAEAGHKRMVEKVKKGK